MISAYQFSRLSAFSPIRHFISTRKGGVSKGCFESLNMGLFVGDDPELVMENRARLAKSQECLPTSYILPQLTHGSRVAVVSSSDKGRGFWDREAPILDTDALITNHKGVGLIVTLADCTPLLFYDAQQEAIGIAHSGWKGTIAQIGKKTVESMGANFGSQPRHIWAGIGPSIGKCCYEVSKELAESFQDVFGDEVFSVSEKGEYFLDLWKANYISLVSLGIPPAQIEVAGICTACHSHTYFSHRKEGGETGRFCAGIMLKE